MGVVYMAEDTKLNRVVARKMLPNAALGRAEDTARFSREEQAAAQLNNANIATVYAIEEAAPDGAAPGTPVSPFMAMEDIDGETLAQRIEGGLLRLEEAIDIAVQVVSALWTTPYMSPEQAVVYSI